MQYQRPILVEVYTGQTDSEHLSQVFFSNIPLGAQNYFFLFINIFQSLTKFFGKTFYD